MSSSSIEIQAQAPCQLELNCPVEKPLLRILRRFVMSVAEEMGFTEEDVTKIEMAVDEACTNVIHHAYAEKAKPRGNSGLRVKIVMDADALTIFVQDRGKGRVVGKFKGVRSLSEYQRLGRREYRGLGILIMKEFMDEVQFVVDPHAGTVVTLRKFLPKPPTP